MHLLACGSRVSHSEVHMDLKGHSFNQEGHNNTVVLLTWIT